MIACSTSWNQKNHDDIGDAVREILDLGFDGVELSHGLHATDIDKLLKLRERLEFRVSSLHCFCPAPPESRTGNPNSYQFTSHRPSVRDRAVTLVNRTIDTARQFGARCVVVHAGSIHTMKVAPGLLKLLEAGKLFNKQYAKTKLDAVLAREKKIELYMRRVLDCLAPIAEHAATCNVLVGIENRQDFEEMPAEWEFEEMFRRLDAPHVGYWHDFGHAQIKHNLGFIDHAQWLDRIGSRTFGAHVHDVQWPVKDHLAPFTGEVRFATLVPKLPGDADFVFEMTRSVAATDVATALTRWRRMSSHSGESGKSGESGESNDFCARRAPASFDFPDFPDSPDNSQ